MGKYFANLMKFQAVIIVNLIIKIYCFQFLKYLVLQKIRLSSVILDFWKIFFTAMDYVKFHIIQTVIFFSLQIICEKHFNIMKFQHMIVDFHVIDRLNDSKIKLEKKK